MTVQGSLDIRDLAVVGRNGPIVSSVSFDVRAGEVEALVGPSGSGKTTILHAIAGSLSEGLTWSGCVRLAGQSIRRDNQGGDGVAISVISQRPLEALNPVLSAGRVVDEVARARLRQLTGAERRQAARTAFAEVGLPDAAMHYRPNQLSGGGRQRVMLAAALIGNPRLILADEPTAAMDVIARREVFELLRGIARRRTIPVLVATHDRTAIRQYCDRAVILAGGNRREGSSRGGLGGSPTP